MDDMSKVFYRYFHTTCTDNTITTGNFLPYETTYTFYSHNNCLMCKSDDEKMICNMIAPNFTDNPLTISEVNKYVKWKRTIHRSVNATCVHNNCLSHCHACEGNLNYERYNLFWNVIYSIFPNKYINITLNKMGIQADDFKLKRKGMIYWQLIDDYILQCRLEWANTTNDDIQQLLPRNNLMSEIRNTKMRCLFPNILHATWSGEYISAEQIRLRESVPESYGKQVP